MIDPLGRSRHPYRIPRAMSRLAAVAGAVGLLGGCGTLASGTIVAARTPVNEAVATTSRQQTLMNIIRVYHNESPIILDIVETDETVGVGAQATGGVAGIGPAAGRSGSASGALTASDSVTNRLIPLQGQALISQLSSQITVETLNALCDSDWPIQSITEFAIDKLTPENASYDLAEDLLAQLDTSYAIALATAKSGFSSSAVTKSIDHSKQGTITINTQAPSGGGGDTLNIYLDPSQKDKHTEIRNSLSRIAWDRLSTLYSGTQPNQTGRDIIRGLSYPKIIELRNSPRTHVSELSARSFSETSLGPVMRTRTAIGILKYIVTQPDVAFVTPAQYNYIRTRPWNNYDVRRGCGGSEFYILPPEDSPIDRAVRQEGEDGLTTYFSHDLKRPDDPLLISSYLSSISAANNPFAAYFDAGDHACAFSYGVLPFAKTHIADLKSFATDMGFLKRFILIVKSENPPTGSYTNWFSHGWNYWIEEDDIVSQRNLMLISQFLTIQATATPSPALTTISASGR